jgi:predicted glycosyltransferase involved in capsule biosynthesis
MKKLSVIIPFRGDKSNPWFIERLEGLLSEIDVPDCIEIIVVDSGSAIDEKRKCIELCEFYRAKYLRLENDMKTFSIGEARDFGVQNALGKAITFLDVDLRLPTGFWENLLQLMDVYGIRKFKKKFFSIPCIYLTPEGTKSFKTTESNIFSRTIHLNYLTGNSEWIDSYAPCSSVMVVDRLHYLSCGGHDPRFRGHGYEDFELYHRLLQEEGSITRPRDYYQDKKTWETSTYQGFRAMLAILGKIPQAHGLFVIHLWHPRPKTNSHYANISKNRNIWIDIFKEYDSSSFHPEPLADYSVTKQSKVLFFGKPRTNAARCLKDAAPLLGDFIYASEYDFFDGDEFLADDFECFLADLNISLIVFFNPYGNKARLETYRWCQKTNTYFLCFERGALPDSWFFDSSGFNADSKSYSKNNLKNFLTEEERELVSRYIYNTINIKKPLENQNLSLGKEAIIQKYRLQGKKILFVPLQRPSDTVIKYMSGKIQDADHFVQIIDEVSRELIKKGWVVLVKKHPLETKKSTFKYASYVDDDVNFIDLIEASDAVALINSGVGIYAMMMNKPCFIFGEAFYSLPGANFEVDSFEIADVTNSINAHKEIDFSLVERFIFYLITEFYSFGITKVEARIESDGSKRSITKEIDFYELRIPKKESVIYEENINNKLPISAPIYSKYALDIHLTKKKVKTIKTRPSTNTSPSKNVAPKKVHPKRELRSPAEIKKAKRMKLKNNPHAYFADSKIWVLKPLRFFFKKHA